jgi:PPOX class probable F420-dependent enzyme
MTKALTDATREFLSTGRHYASIATVDPDGAPRQAVIWYRMDGDDLIINSLVGRRWPTNLLRDARISVAVIDRLDGERWVGVVGTAEPITDQPTAQADIAAMSRHYHADEPAEAERLIAERFERQERISFRIRATAVHDHLDD